MLLAAFGSKLNTFNTLSKQYSVSIGSTSVTLQTISGTIDIPIVFQCSRMILTIDSSIVENYRYLPIATTVSK